MIWTLISVLIHVRWTCVGYVPKKYTSILIPPNSFTWSRQCAATAKFTMLIWWIMVANIFTIELITNILEKLYLRYDLGGDDRFFCATYFPYFFNKASSDEISHSCKWWAKTDILTPKTQKLELQQTKSIKRNTTHLQLSFRAANSKHKGAIIWEGYREDGSLMKK